MDHSNGDLPVFESGAIMMYLAERYGDGSLLPKEGKVRYEVIQWLMFQMGGVGPMMGQASHFIHYAPESVPYGQKRYYNESKRLLGVLESRLKDHEYLAGDQFTLADIANFCWVLYAFHAAIDVDEFPSVKVRVVVGDGHFCCHLSMCRNGSNASMQGRRRRKALMFPKAPSRRYLPLSLSGTFKEDNVMRRKWWKMTLPAKPKSMRIAAELLDCEPYNF